MSFIFSFSDTDSYLCGEIMNIMTENWREMTIITDSIFKVHDNILIHFYSSFPQWIAYLT
jgi:hypothetical protein